MKIDHGQPGDYKRVFLMAGFLSSLLMFILMMTMIILDPPANPTDKGAMMGIASLFVASGVASLMESLGE